MSMQAQNGGISISLNDLQPRG